MGIFYPVKIFDIQFIPVLQRVIADFSISAVVIAAVIIIFTLIFGRFYCSCVCPLGIVQEFINIGTGKKYKKSVNLPLKYIIAALTVGFLVGGSAAVIRYSEPYTYFVSAQTSAIIGIIGILFVIFIAIFKGRFFCTNICPVGTILGLLSKVSLFKIYFDKNSCVSCSMCEKKCPAGSIDHKEKIVDNETCVKCLRCLASCPKNALMYGKNPQKLNFDIGRRKFITLAFTSVVFAAAVKSGLEFSKSAVKNIKDIIIPPGGVSPQRLFHKCLNCNLCADACPEKIIKKANKSFGAVHIEYNRNGLCKFDCNACSDVCPSGALKRISKEEKQNTRIAMAVINKDKCIRCGLCEKKCPKNTIKQAENESLFVDPSDCIGCAACKSVCPVGAAEIFAIKEQKII